MRRTKSLPFQTTLVPLQFCECCKEIKTSKTISPVPVNSTANDGTMPFSVNALAYKMIYENMHEGKKMGNFLDNVGGEGMIVLSSPAREWPEIRPRSILVSLVRLPIRKPRGVRKFENTWKYTTTTHKGQDSQEIGWKFMKAEKKGVR